jgi:acetylglutamate kinase
MQAASISFVESTVKLVGVVTHIIHTARDNRGVSAIFQLKASSSKIVVVAEFGTINHFPIVGDIWKVSGEHKSDPTYGSQFKVEDASKQLPDPDTSYEVISDFLVFNANFVGINRHWANKLSRVYENKLFYALESISATDLATNKKLKMSATMASNLLESWHQISNECELNDFFKDKHFPEELIETTRQLLGNKAIELLYKNPYLLYPIMSVKAPYRKWKELDSTIRKQFGIKKNDRRRAISFIESILYAAYSQQGHMSLPVGIVNEAIKESNFSFDFSILNDEHDKFRTLCFNKDSETVQILGHQAIEKTINSLLNKRLCPAGEALDFDNYDIEETFSKLASIGIELNTEQQLAFDNALTKSVSVVDGSAYSGKSTIIQSVIDVLIGNGENVWLISSSSGDEAKGLFRVGGESINSFISKSQKRNKLDALNDSVVIVDDAHSVDTLTFYKLLKCLPLNTRLCFVGDHRKLPPLGPGNVFQQLISTNSELITRLEHSSYHDANDSLRALSLAMLVQDSNYDTNSIPSSYFNESQGISIYETLEKSHDVLSNIAANIWLELHLNLDKSYQVICANSSLCKLISMQIQQLRFTRKKVANLTIDECTFYEGDPVIFVKKNQFLDMASGDLAIVHEVFNEPVIVHGRECLLSILVNETVVELSKEDIDCLSICYAITAHKVQNHKFESSVVVLDNFYLINKAWLYTAANATHKNLMFIGNKVGLARELNSPEFSNKRYFGIPLKLAV